MSFASGGRGLKAGTGTVLYFAPLDGDATVDANVIKKYRSPTTVATDHGDGSLLHEGSKVAIQNIETFLMGGFGDAAIATVLDRTFGTSTAGDDSADAGAAPTGFDVLPAADLPIYEVTAVTIDGVAVSRILYTEEVATALTGLDDTLNGEVWINPNTGTWKTSRSTSGAGAGVVFTYKTANLDALKAQALMRPFEVVTFAGWRYSEQYYGMWQDLITWARANGKVVVAALEDSVVPTDVETQELLNGIRSDSFATLASKLVDPTEDLTSAYAAKMAKSPVNGTLKDQAAPAGVTYSSVLPYTRDDFGDDVDPNSGTFHYYGANAVTLSDDGASFVISSDRAMTAYSDVTDVLFIGVTRTVNATNGLVGFEMDNFLTKGGLKPQALFDGPGLKLAEATIRGALGQAASADKRWILPEFVLSAPGYDETLASDRKKRNLVGTFIYYTVVNPMQTAEIVTEVGQ